MLVDLTQYITDYGIYNLKAKATDGTQYADSDFSNVVEYNIPLATIALSGDNLIVTNLSAEATGVQIYANGELKATVIPSTTIDLTQLGLADGRYQIYISLVGGALRANRSNSVLYAVGVVDFKDADWAIVKYVMQNNLYDKYGWSVGDTKTLTYIESGEEKTYTVRLSDRQLGRYKYSNSDRRTNGVLEMVEILTQTAQMNSTNTNVGGFAESRMRKTVNGLSGYQYDLYSPLPADLKAVLEDIDIPTATSGTDATALTSPCKVFLPSAPEVNLPTYGRDVDGTVWDWYSEHGTNADRVKYRLGSTSGASYWVRNPRQDSTLSFSGVNFDGGGSSSGATTSSGVVLCFAF